MQKKVLESLAARGSFVGLMLPGFSSYPLHAVSSFVHSLSADVLPLVVDLGTGQIPVSSPLSTESLFKRTLSVVESEKSICALWEGLSVITSLGKMLDAEDTSVRQFVRNIQVLQKSHPFIVLLYPETWNETHSKIFCSCGFFLVVLGEKANVADVASELENVNCFPKQSIWWSATEYPEKKRFPKVTRAIRSVGRLQLPSSEQFLDKPELFAQAIKNMLKARVLVQNPLEGLPYYFRRVWVILCLLLCAIPFLVPTKIDTGLSMLREMRPERDRYSDAPYFNFVFDGTETLQRISRYAVGRFTATVTSDKILSSYVKDVLKQNDFPENSWQKDDLIYPPAGTQLRFLPPQNIHNAYYDSIAPAWKYFTGMISDSIAYLTEMYHEQATDTYRLHTGIDVASRMGARILAPFNAKAWTLKDERGGVVIGLVHEKAVMLFMHCDQLLYLDGQDVMQGDPIATVGTTGHTTGPHVHLVTGIVDPKGPKIIGNMHYRIVNPITWFYFQTKK